eukprot:scaffold1124_cov131-Isochrysis_galbana.AAC.4
MRHQPSLSPHPFPPPPPLLRCSPRGELGPHRGKRGARVQGERAGRGGRGGRKVTPPLRSGCKQKTHTINSIASHPPDPKRTWPTSRPTPTGYRSAGRT